MTTAKEHCEIIALQTHGDECVRWPKGLDVRGYGQLNDGGKIKKAHRVICELRYGLPPTEDETHVLHSCDNPWCVNPNHLKWGSNRQNKAEMVLRNRSAKGSRHSHAVLNEEQVLKIRELTADNVSASELAKQFGVSAATIYLIRKRRIWRHI